MAATSLVRSFVRAALAAVFVLVSSCGGGGGGNTSSTAVAPSAPVVTPPAPAASAPVATVPFIGNAVNTGMAFDGQSRASVLAASQAAVSLDIQFSFTTAVTVSQRTVRALALTPATIMSAGEIFTNAERVFSTLFAPAHGPLELGTLGGEEYEFWCYPNGNCLGGRTVRSATDPGGIYGIGPFTNGQLVRYETAAYWTCVFEPTRCGPKITSARIINTAGETLADVMAPTNTSLVPAKGTKLVLGYDSAINCTGIDGTRVLGQIVATLACNNAGTLTVTPGAVGEERWPMGVRNTLTIGGLRNAEGYPSASQPVSFATNPPQVAAGGKVYTGNWSGRTQGDTTWLGNAVSLFDVRSETLTRQIDFGTMPGYTLFYGQVVIDPIAGVVYVTPEVGYALYRIDLETDTLMPLLIAPGFPFLNTKGAVLTESEFCVILGITGLGEYSLDNTLRCRHRFTNGETFVSPRHFLGDTTLTPLRMSYAQGKLYVAMATKAASFIEPLNDAARGRDGWLPGTVGQVVEIDATTKATSRVFVVGSAPRGMVVSADETVLHAFNLGDKSVSSIDLVTGTVTTQPLGMSGFERPITALPDWEKGRIYVSDDVSSIRILHPTTLVETGRIEFGPDCTAANMAIVSGKLWVACYKRDTFKGNDKVLIIDRDTLRVTNTIVTRNESTVPDFRPNMPWAITAYVPAQ